MKLLITGSESIKLYPDLERRIKAIVKNTPLDEIHFITRDNNGMDRIANKHLESLGLDVQKYVIEWDKYGKKAVHTRNNTVAKKATHAIIFWDGLDEDTKSLIELLDRHQVMYRVVKVKDVT